MTDPFASLAAVTSRWAAHPVPRAWTSQQPALTQFRSLAEVISAIGDVDPADRSDLVIRALSVLADTDPFAATVLIHGLAIFLRDRRLRGEQRRSWEYLADAVADLTLVVYEADDLQTTSGLARRLARRAHTRVSKRYRRGHEISRQQCEIRALLDEREASGHYVPEGLRIVEALTATDSTEAVDDRLELAEFGAAVARAIGTGDLPEHVWQTWRDGHLRAALTGDRGDRTAVDRNRSRRAGLKVRSVIATARIA
jgi:hypothetical protein